MTRAVRRWTPDEITKLKEMAGKYPRDTIAEQLGRAGSAVAMKACAGRNVLLAKPTHVPTHTPTDHEIQEQPEH
jgi:hypothetical protein